MFGITSRYLLAVLMVVLMLVGVATAVSIVSLNNPGHVRILKGNRADLLVTPSTIEFGNVTVGDPANVTVTIQNMGNCLENVTLTVNPGNVPQQPSIYSPFTLQPGMTIGVLASYTANQTLTMPPGDYTFTLNSTASCL